MGFNATTYVLSKKYTDETAKEFGALKGAPCTIKSIEKLNNQNIVTFEWQNSQGETRESIMSVKDGTPIYTWESGHSYIVNDLVIYGDGLYRCIKANSDTSFNRANWVSIGGGGGSADGNYNIVQNRNLLPDGFTEIDRKMYYSIDDNFFWLWDGNRWVAQATTLNGINLVGELNTEDFGIPTVSLTREDILRIWNNT